MKVDRHFRVPEGAKIRTVGDEIEECGSCHHGDPEGYYFVKEDWGPGYENFLCTVCYHTWAGNAAHYPTQYEPSQLYSMLAQCTNMVLRKIEATHIDDPQWDSTDYAHPAWWRGHDYTMDRVTEQLAKALGVELAYKNRPAEMWRSMIKTVRPIEPDAKQD